MNILGIDRYRFWSKVKKTSGGCWFWTASVNHGGYGKFWVDGHTIQAHRVAYILERGEIEEGLTLDHLCRERRCVKPAHLEPVTIKENLDRSPRNPKYRTHCPSGHVYDLVNTSYTVPGERRCRECAKIRTRKRNRERGAMPRLFTVGGVRW